MKPAFLICLLFTVHCLPFVALAKEGSLVTASSGGKRLFRFDSKADFSAFTMTGAAWDHDEIVFEEGKGIAQGLVESPYVETGFPFDQAVVSWNAITPPNSYLTVYIRVRSGGFWSRRFTVAIWNQDNRPVQRMSVNGQKDDIAEMDSDTLLLQKPGDAFQVSAKLSSLDGETYPALRLLTVDVVDSKSPAARLRAHKSVWGTDIAVPERSQLTVTDGVRFCSATSTSMVLAYWAEKLNHPKLTVPLQTAVDGIYDKEWGGTGNWTFNTAYAGEFGGLKAYVTRLRGTADAEKWIAKGVPVIISIDYNVIRGRKGGRMGHLMVLRGFTENGDCIINDPYTKLDQGESVRKVFKRKDFERSWLSNVGSLGTVYLIYPTGWDIPD